MVTDETQPRRGLSVQNLMSILPFLVTVVCLFGTCLLYIANVAAKSDRNDSAIAALKEDNRELEQRINGRIDEQARRNETQYQNIRSDVQEVNRKLDQIIMGNRK